MAQSKLIPLPSDSVFPKDKNARIKALDEARQKNPVENGRRIAGLSGEYDIFEIDVDDLIYNFHNYRFFLERATIEKQKSRQFYEDEEHRYEAARITEEKIWEQDESENEDTVGSLLAEGQIEPAICDMNGVVIAGNRRLTLLHQIKRRRDSGYYKKSNVSPGRFDELSKLRVAIIDKGLEVSEIIQYETKLQHNNPKKLEYDRIAKYFIVKNLIEKEHLSPQQIYDDNKGMPSLKNVAAVDKFVRVAKLMEEYLRFFKIPEIYIELRGMEDPMRKLDDDLLRIRSGDRPIGNEDSLYLEYRNTFFTALRAHAFNKESGLKEKWYRDLFNAFKRDTPTWRGLKEDSVKVQMNTKAPDSTDDSTLKESKQEWTEAHAEKVTSGIGEVVDEVRDFERFNEKPEKLLARAMNDLEQFEKMISSADKDFYLEGIDNPSDTINDLYRRLDAILNKLPVE